MQWKIMEYIIVVEYESTREITCNLLGLPSMVLSNLEIYLKAHNINCNNHKDFFEVDTAGIIVINILSGNAYNYRVVSQSMAIDATTIGGGSVKEQKTVWTLGKRTI